MHTLYRITIRILGEKHFIDLIDKFLYLYFRHRCNYASDLCSGNKIDKLVSAKERGSIPIRSKYFKKQDGSDSELQQASVSSTKLISNGNKRMSTLPNNPALEKRCDILSRQVTL